MGKDKPYTGNKGSGGSFQNIINEFPSHQDFISAFAGSGAVEKKKKPAPGKNIAFELSQKTISTYWKDPNVYTVKNADFVKWYQTQKNILCGPQRLIYADPPYLISERSGGKKHYEYDWTQEQHIQFLELIRDSKDLIAVSHYKCKLYNEYLKGWRVKTWRVMTHTGPVFEALYMNYAKPKYLHQYDFLGDNYTERQRIKRRKETLVKQLESMTAEERTAQLHELNMLNEILIRYLVP